MNEEGVRRASLKLIYARITRAPSSFALLLCASVAPCVKRGSVTYHIGCCEEYLREYLTGFHKRKVERKKAAIEEIKHRLKEEQKKLREERHQEYLKMLAEREEALEEADELDRLVTAKTESVQYDHPNHTVTVTTISDLDLSGARLLGLPPLEQGTGHRPEEEVSSTEKPTRALPRKSRDPLLSQRISALTASLHAHSRKKTKRKRPRRAPDSTKKPPSATRTSKTQRRRLTGMARHGAE
ncbi:nucleolar protein 12 isoform X3 [Mustela nigripes]|uniref:nucleolar protein 12 isoform X3 n=1 Tax=Mustela nigripes TaxID=77151 RepID=UPI002815089D|nr:nucleolar protein 12 isoform X3 [Mustela nigripes]